MWRVAVAGRKADLAALSPYHTPYKVSSRLPATNHNL